jgi:hypothetical protein
MPVDVVVTDLIALLSAGLLTPASFDASRVPLMDRLKTQSGHVTVVQHRQRVSYTLPP